MEILWISREKGKEKSEKSDGVALSEISVDNIRSSSFQSGFAMQILGGYGVPAIA